MWYCILGSQHTDFQLFFLISYLQRALCYPLYCLWNSNRSEGNNPPKSKCCIFPSVMGLDSCSMPNTMIFSVHYTQVAGIHYRAHNVPPLQGEEISSKSLLQYWKETHSDPFLYSLSPKQHLKICAQYGCLFKVSYLNNNNKISLFQMYKNYKNIICIIIYVYICMCSVCIHM